MTKNEKMMTKIRNLLDTTEANGATAEETQSAIALAQKLMAKHNIAVSQITAGGKTKAVEPTIGLAFEASKLQWWVKVLGAAIAENFRVKVYTQRINAKSRGIVFMGEPDDIEIATHVYKFALAQMEHHAAKYRRRRRAAEKKQYGSLVFFDGNAVRNDYMSGYINGLKDKLKAQVDADEAFALAVQTPHAVTKRWNEMQLGRDNVKVRSAGDSDARQKGYEQGQKFSAPAGSLSHTS